MNDEIAKKEDIKVIEIKQRLNEIENQYDCCSGSHIDKRFLEFLTKSFAIISILIFCFIRILTSDNQNENQVYFNFIVLIAGSFLPSPTIKKK